MGLTASVQRGVADIAASVPAVIAGEPRERPLDHPALLWTAVARCLVRGDPDPSVRRPGLPAELVLPISKLCGFVRPSSRPIRWAEPPKPLRIESHGPLQREKWATSEPLAAEVIASLAALRVVTVSANQGWRVSIASQGVLTVKGLASCAGHAVVFVRIGRLEGGRRGRACIQPCQSHCGASGALLRTMVRAWCFFDSSCRSLVFTSACWRLINVH